MKRFLSILLALLMVATLFTSVLTSCKKPDNGPEKPNVDDPVIETDWNPNLPKQDFGGHKFNFISQEAPSHGVHFLVSQGETGETLDDAIARRNALLEEKYNVKVTHTVVTDVVTDVRAQVMGGVTEFDAILASCKNTAILAQENLLYNLLDIELFNWDAPYWDSNSRDQLMIGDKLYFANCALNIHTIGFGVYFNKKLVQDYGLTSPHVLMENNEWTIDNWATMVKAVSKDLDNDGAMTELDQYGTLAEHHNARMFLYASGERATTNDANGYPQVTLMNNSDKVVTLYDKLKDALADQNSAYCIVCSKVGNNGYASKWEYIRYLFTQDKYMFYYSSEDVLTRIKDMESEFGIAPFPKYDKAQEQYKTVYPYNNALLSIPNCADIDRTATLLEDMNYFSTLTVLPAWYDTLLARRYARDDESEASLKLLRENCVYDIGLYYDFGGLVNNVLDVDPAKVNISRDYAKWKKPIEASIAKVYESFLKAK